MKPTTRRVTEALSNLEEEQFTLEVVVPLIEALHPGRVEFTHSPLEGGRDLVSFGKDYIDRSHILCVQVKAVPLSFGAPAFTDVVNAAHGALRIEVTKENGETSYPNEVWVVSSKPFGEHKRRQLTGYLNNLDRQSIKIIAAEELSDLLIRHTPSLAASLSKYMSPDVVTFLAELSMHREGRAFGFSFDRDIDEFYVATTLSPRTPHVDLLMSDAIEVESFDVQIGIAPDSVIQKEQFRLSNRDLRAQVLGEIVRREVHRSFEGFPVEASVDLYDDIEVIRSKYLSSVYFSKEEIAKASEVPARIRKRVNNPVGEYLLEHLSGELRSQIKKFKKGDSASAIIEPLVKELNFHLPKSELLKACLDWNPALSEICDQIVNGETNIELFTIANRFCLDEYFSQQISRKGPTASNFINARITYNLKKTLKAQVGKLKKLIRECPKVLNSSPTKIQETLAELEKNEGFLQLIPSRHMRYKTDAVGRINETQIRIQLKHAKNLLSFSRLILIEGPPGCGKTTLMRMLGIELLNGGQKLVYLPCFKIGSAFSSKSLEEILNEFALGGKTFDWKKRGQHVLVIDGLDEGPFNISDLVLKNCKDFQNVIVSMRHSYSSSLRRSFSCISVAPFTQTERDEFFSLWLGGETPLRRTLSDLVGRYKDIDIHTRLPLIATIAVALVQRGFKPTTRAEVYSDRLTLLLSNWDKLRGVNRLKVDYPDAKRRFLRKLAYSIHSDTARSRHKDDNEIIRRRQIDLENLLEIYERSLGTWGYGVDYKKILDDLTTGSGILIEERPGVYSFGHLTFQEHLVGEYLAEKFSVQDLLELLGHDWWREPLNFYASIVGDVSKLIEMAMERGTTFLAHIKQLTELVEFAPYTSPGAIDCMKDSRGPIVEPW